MPLYIAAYNFERERASKEQNSTDHQVSNSNLDYSNESNPNFYPENINQIQINHNFHFQPNIEGYLFIFINII